MTPRRRALLWLACLHQLGRFGHSLVVGPTQRRVGFGALSSTTEMAEEQQIVEEESNFWFTKIRKRPREEDNKTRIPYIPNLDVEGALPNECYRTLGKVEHESRPTCMVATRLDGANDANVEELIPKLQTLIDAGLTTFQGGDDLTYRQLLAETPRSVLQHCNLIVSIPTPTRMQSAAHSARDLILQRLQSIGGEALDTVQLQYNPESPYHLDIMDVLMDLQRDGLVRSVAGRGTFPASLLREADACGFRIDFHQLPLNLLNPTKDYNAELLKQCKDTDTPLIVEDALAGGLLTDRHVNQPAEPYLFELEAREKPHMASLHSWANRRVGKAKSSWPRFQKDVMGVLDNIALKHRVSVGTVALRWTLQLDSVTSALVGWEMYRTDIFDYAKALREVFELELDEQDMERLWEATGCEKPNLETPGFDFENLDGLEEDDNGLFLPSNGKLWI